MVQAVGDFDATLAAAAGEDHELFVELRAAFIGSLERQIDLLRRARCDGNWHV
ncbi:MAG TPA: Hpt domain-containing protein, partial [Croceibacterium sp.]